MNFDIAIIGGGPAGYTADSIKSASNMAFLPNLLRLI